MNASAGLRACSVLSGNDSAGRLNRRATRLMRRFARLARTIRTSPSRRKMCRRRAANWSRRAPVICLRSSRAAVSPARAAGRHESASRGLQRQYSRRAVPLYRRRDPESDRRSRRLKLAKAQAQLEAVVDRVTMDVRLAFYELLLNRERIQVREESVAVLQQQFKTQRERFSAGTVGELNVSRAEVSVANEEPDLFQARTDLQNSYLRLGELLGENSTDPAGRTVFFSLRRTGLRATTSGTERLPRPCEETRPELRAADADIAIEEQQLALDRSTTRPHFEALRRLRDSTTNGIRRWGANLITATLSD